MEQVKQLIERLIAGQTMVQGTLSNQRRKAPDQATKVQIKPVLLKGKQHYQFTSTIGQKVLHENIAAEEAGDKLMQLIHEDFKQVLQHEMFDNSRLAIAKKTIAENAFSSVQVKEMMELFGFDNNKLEIAKISYRNTVDKNNYFMIYDCFAFSTTKEELAKYIETCK